jgi:capsular polysaccharide biosynthesis protein
MKTITMKEIIKALLDRIILVVIIPFVAVSVTAYISYEVLEPTYTATTTMYVLNRQSENTVNYSELMTGEMLIADYQQLALSDRVMKATAKETGLENLGGYAIDVSAASNTRIIVISVEGTDPAMAAEVANSIAGNLSDCIMDVMRVENISVIDDADPPGFPSGPNKLMNIALAGVLGLALSIFLTLVIEMMNTTIRTTEDVESALGLPVLAKVPKFEIGGKKKWHHR